MLEVNEDVSEIRAQECVQPMAASLDDEQF